MLNIEDYIRTLPNFPKPNIQFKDITPLLANPKAIEQCVQNFLDALSNQKIDKVVGIESRGFFFGILLAKALNAGFIPIRKAGKLPYKTLKEPYNLEYGTDTLEIHEDAIKKGEKVLLHDDVLATGGTAKAATQLIKRLGGELVQCNFLIELKALNGRQQLNNYEVNSLLSY